MDTQNIIVTLKKDSQQDLSKFRTVNEIDAEEAEADSTAISRAVNRLIAEGKLPPKRAQK